MSSLWSQLVADATTTLRDAGVPNPDIDALELASYVSGVPRGELHARIITGTAVATADQHDGYAQAVQRRVTREPLQHITAHAPFRDLELRVGPGVFVPRPETEYVVEVALGEVRNVAHGSSELTVVDLCTGSGAIALALAHELPQANVWAVELDQAAAQWARQNIADQPESIRSRITLVRGDARTALQELDGRCDLVVSNPPYIPPDAVPREQEVRDYDPPIALYGLGPDGLEVPRGISTAAVRLLRPAGVFVMEHAEVQAGAVRTMLDGTIWSDIRTAADLTGRDRMVVARRRDADVQSLQTTTSDCAAETAAESRVEQGMES